MCLKFKQKNHPHLTIMTHLQPIRLQTIHFFYNNNNFFSYNVKCFPIVNNNNNFLVLVVNFWNKTKIWQLM